MWRVDAYCSSVEVEARDHPQETKSPKETKLHLCVVNINYNIIPLYSLQHVNNIGYCPKPVFLHFVWPNILHEITNMWTCQLNRSSELRAKQGETPFSVFTIFKHWVLKLWDFCCYTLSSHLGQTVSSGVFQDHLYTLQAVCKSLNISNLKQSYAHPEIIMSIVK